MPMSESNDQSVQPNSNPPHPDPASGRVDVLLADRSYSILITSGGFDQFARQICDQIPDLTHAVILADDAVHDRWSQPLADAFPVDRVRVSQRTVPSGEPSKSIEQFHELLQWMLGEGADRRSMVVAVGGGVIGDLAGYVAASFTRGIRFVQVPTTLLAMVDSSVGGKTGINLPGAKNMVGAFWQPSLVAIDTDVLSTLPDRSYISGLAEVVKYGVIDDSEFFHWLESHATRLVQRDAEALRFAIEKSCRCKAAVVGEDERETSGRRAILNYGHTFAHAIEATAGYGTLLHGEAVAIGMQMAAQLAIDQRLCDRNLLQRQTNLLEKCRLPIRFPDADPDAMLPVMSKDKKVAHGKLRFILPREIGRVELIGDVAPKAVRDAIAAWR